MGDSVTVIDIVAQVTDETERGAGSATKNVTKLEQSMQKVQRQIDSMKGKSKMEVRATLKDMASRGLQAIADKGKQIAGKVWTVTLKAADLVTAPFKKVLGLITSPVAQMAAFAGISLGVADTINTFKNFEQGMANVKAISGATGAEFEELTATAKKLGESTMFSAAQAAEAMENLAMAGWKSKDIIAGMPGLLDLAAAGSVDLATASDVVASAIAQFKLNASESTKVADILAATATNSKTDVQGLGESFKYAGSLAGALGFDMQDVAVAFGIMGNSAIDASSAGTALRGMLARMSKQEGLTSEESNAVAEAMKKVGVSMTNSKGESKDLLTIIKELRKGFSGMSEAEKSATAANLAGQNAMSGLLALVNASDADFDKLTDSIYNSQGAAAKMAGIKMDTLQGSLYYLQSAVEGVKIAVGEKLQPYVKGFVDWLTAHTPDVQTAVGEAVDFITGKIDSVVASIQTLTASPEWAKAETLWDKLQLAWDKLIAEPFDAWWNGTGKAWMAEKAQDIGKGIGFALKTGILALLGVDIGGAAEDGVSIGKSFAEGFMEGFDGKKVGEAIWKAIKGGTKSLASDAATLLPGGKEASETAGLSAAVLGYGAYKAGKTGYGAYKAGKGIVNGAKGIGSAIGNVTGISDGIQIAKAAKGGSAAAQSALAMAEGGALGTGAKIGAKVAGGASKLGQVASKAAIPLAAVTSAIEMGVDAYHGVGKAKEWTGSDSTGAKVASGIGAALGGTGDGILGKDSIGKKAMNIGGGALKGAGIGAAIGSIIPGLGTAVGAGVGGAIGGIGAAIGGSNISKGLKAAGDAVGSFFTQTVPDAVSKVGEKAGVFFTETVPAKWDEFITGVGNFFTQQIPYAVGYAAGKVTVFVTETLPQGFGELMTGIGNFFTKTIPNALMAAGAAISTFVTVTVPAFFGDMWDGLVEFFTKTIPTALETVGTALDTFITETVPDFFGDMWDGLVTFFTEAIPNATKEIRDGISGFFSSLGDRIGEFFSGLWEDVSGSASAGYQAATAHAEGGIMTRPHVGLVAEDGAEAIIPLSGKRRERGIDLWERAGRMLGVKPYADGGMAGLPDADQKPAGGGGASIPMPGSASASPTGGGVTVSIGALTFEINAGGGNAPDAQTLVATIKENIRSMTDEIAYQLALAIQQAFANTPTASWEG